MNLRFEWINWRPEMGPNQTAWAHSNLVENIADSLSRWGIEKWGQTHPPDGRSASRMHTRSVCPETGSSARAAAHNAAGRTPAGVWPATEVSG